MSKVGRNDPCPCGSGKKHKKCCINKDKPTSKFSPKEAASSGMNPQQMAQAWMANMAAQAQMKQQDTEVTLILDRYLVSDENCKKQVAKLGKVSDSVLEFREGKQKVGEAVLSIEGEIVVTTASLEIADKIKSELNKIEGVSFDSRAADKFEKLDAESKAKLGLEMLEFKTKFFKAWVDEPNERLQGKTPRQSTKDPRLRKLLIALIKELEKKEKKLPKKEQFRFAEVKKVLGL